ncbi:MAG: CAP domain-containing protein [Thermoleophilaceae bacterium]
MLALRTFVLSAALLATLVPAATAGAKKPTPADRMIAKINKARGNHGLRPLRTAPKLMRSSRGYARHLIRTDTFGHGSSYASAGFKRSGEILALTRGWRRKPHPALGLWLHSAGHRALILSSSFRYVGVSPARGHFGGRRTTIWVAHFGAH